MVVNSIYLSPLFVPSFSNSLPLPNPNQFITLDKDVVQMWDVVEGESGVGRGVGMGVGVVLSIGGGMMLWTKLDLMVLVLTDIVKWWCLGSVRVCVLGKEKWGCGSAISSCCG